MGSPLRVGAHFGFLALPSTAIELLPCLPSGGYQVPLPAEVEANVG